jgi:hypothetical protein
MMMIVIQSRGIDPIDSHHVPFKEGVNISKMCGGIGPISVINWRSIFNGGVLVISDE